MTAKNHYTVLGVASNATQDQIKRAYRKLARRFHPDVSHEAAAEERFKEIASAHETLIDHERRAQYDAERALPLPKPDPTAGWQHGFATPDEGALHSAFREFFVSPPPHRQRRMRGEDLHASISIELADAYRGATRTLRLRSPGFNADGVLDVQDRVLEVSIPQGVRPGQHLRLQGQGAPGQGGALAGDLYLEVTFLPHPPFRIEAGDVYLDLPVTPWEAALGATVTASTPTGSVQVIVPPGSVGHRRLRLKGQGLPGSPAGDLYAVLDIALPPGNTAHAQQAYRAMAHAFPSYHPRD